MTKRKSPSFVQPLSHASRASSPSRRALGIRFESCWNRWRSKTSICREAFTSSVACGDSCPPSVAYATSPSGRRESFPKGKPFTELYASRANRSEAFTLENVTACQGLSYYERWHRATAMMTERLYRGRALPWAAIGSPSGRAGTTNVVTEREGNIRFPSDQSWAYILPWRCSFAAYSRCTGQDPWHS